MNANAKQPKTMPLAIPMGEQLRELRLALKLSASEVARRSSVSPSYLAAIESGSSTPSLPVLSRVAHALNVTLGGLLASDVNSTVELSHVSTEPGTFTASSDDLEMHVAFQTSCTGESGICPVATDGHSLVVFVRAGTLEVSVDGEPWTLQEGDSLHATEPSKIEWATNDGAATVVWAAAPVAGS